jgi:hypothetical protein
MKCEEVSNKSSKSLFRTVRRHLLHLSREKNGAEIFELEFHAEYQRVLFSKLFSH